MHGQFVWYELLTPDATSALRFYPAITGWGTDEFDETAYTMWTSGGMPLGGVLQMNAEQRERGIAPHWLPYIEVDDLERSVAQAQSLGGVLVFGPHDVAGVGRFAVLKDPQGALFAAYKPLEPADGFAGRRIAGRFVWHELLANDVPAAYAFYRALFGWDKTSIFDMGPELGAYQMYGKGGAEYGGMYKGAGPMANLPPSWTCYVHVNDVAKAAETARRMGGTVLNGPMEVPGGDWIAVISDPQGAVFAVHQNAPVTAGLAGARSAKKAASTRRKPPASRTAKAKAKKPSAKKPSAKTRAGKKPARKATSKTTARKKAARRPRKRVARRAVRRATPKQRTPEKRRGKR